MTDPSEVQGAVRRAGRTVLVVDVVEYVRLMEADEIGTAQRWQRFVDDAVSAVLSQHGGRLVKSTGDGLVAEFAAVDPAVRSAYEMHQSIAGFNAEVPPQAAMWLRCGAAVGDLYANEHDVQGRAVNLASRLAALGGPGDTVVSVEVRDRLVPGLDAETEDMGECYLKHLSQPVRAFRIGQRAAGAGPGPGGPGHPLQAGVAVLPLHARLVGPEYAALGHLIADELVGGLSRSGQLHVISSLSSTAAAERGLTVGQIGRLLNAAYVVGGAFVVVGPTVRVHAELARADTEEVIWSEDLSARVDEVLAGTDGIVPCVVAAVGAAISRETLARANGLPLPNLESYKLLMLGVGLIHRSSRQDFERAHDVLEHLAQRHSRLPQPLAWLGKWHAMRVVQGLSSDPAQEARRALDRAHRALDADAESSLALTMAGLVHGFMLRDLQTAERCYAQALDANPNEALAWLYTGTLRGWQGRGEEAFAAATKALSLSPLDPMKYYFDSLAAFAALTAGRFAEARGWAEASLRANRLHTATHRTLAIARWLSGDVAGARCVAAEMMKLEPGFSCARYLERFPGGQTTLSRDYTRILRDAGAAP